MTIGHDTAFRVALVQFTASADPDQNLATVSGMVRDARAGGAALICTPENTGYMEADDAAKIAKAQTEPEHRVLRAYRALATEVEASLLVGSLNVIVNDMAKIANRSFLLAPDGGIAGRYDKIHMFDVDLPGREIYRESDTVSAGDRAVVAPTPWGGLGMSICYDVRFPHLYRALAHAGARFITVPAAFTVPTGRAHWHVLLRARAIETACYVFAPAQVGTHPGNRRTFGHSLIVSPWGEVIADGGDAPGVVSADIDPSKIDAARNAVPALAHDRPFALPPPSAQAAE